MAFVELPLHESEAVAAAGYDSVRAILYVKYKPDSDAEGGTYLYFDVPPETADALTDAESHGQFVNWKIKPYYRYERLS